MVRWCCPNERLRDAASASRCSQCSVGLPSLVEGCCLGPCEPACLCCVGVTARTTWAAFQNREPGTRPRNSRQRIGGIILDAATEKKKQLQLLQYRDGPHIPRTPWTGPCPGSGSLGSVSRIITTGPRTGPLPRARRDDATAESRRWPLSCLCCFRRFGCHPSANKLSRVWSGLAPRTTTRTSSLQTPNRQRGSRPLTESP